MFAFLHMMGSAIGSRGSASQPVCTGDTRGYTKCQCICAAGPGCAPAGPTGLWASYALDICHVIIQTRATFTGPCTGARPAPSLRRAADHGGHKGAGSRTPLGCASPAHQGDSRMVTATTPTSLPQALRLTPAPTSTKPSRPCSRPRSGACNARCSSCPPGPAKRLCLRSWCNAAAGGP